MSVLPWLYNSLLCRPLQRVPCSAMLMTFPSTDLGPYGRFQAEFDHCVITELYAAWQFVVCFRFCNCPTVSPVPGGLIRALSYCLTDGRVRGHVAVLLLAQGAGSSIVFVLSFTIMIAFLWIDWTGSSLHAVSLLAVGFALSFVRLSSIHQTHRANLPFSWMDAREDLSAHPSSKATYYTCKAASGWYDESILQIWWHIDGRWFIVSSFVLYQVMLRAHIPSLQQPEGLKGDENVVQLLHHINLSLVIVTNVRLWESCCRGCPWVLFKVGWLNFTVSLLSTGNSTRKKF